MRKFFRMIFISLIVCILCCFFAGCNNITDNTEIQDNNEIQEPIYTVAEVEQALSNTDYKMVMFSTKFANISISSVGVYNMQGVRVDILSPMTSYNYDAVKIEHNDYWNSETRRVKVTFYKFNKIIIDEYTVQDYLEAQVYAICSTDSVTVIAK